MERNKYYVIFYYVSIIIMYTPFWTDKMEILYDRNYIFEIFPTKDFDLIRKLNAIFRFSIYYALIIYFYNRNTNIFYIPIVVGLVTYFVFKKNGLTHIDTIKTDLRNGNVPKDIGDLNVECRIPTKDNPFMNPLLSDFSNDKAPPEACSSYDNKGIQKAMNEKFETGLYRDYTDIFNNGNSQRQFYTVPGSKTPNDQGSFAHWCYGRPPTCKEGNAVACLNQMGRAGGP